MRTGQSGFRPDQEAIIRARITVGRDSSVVWNESSAGCNKGRAEGIGRLAKRWIGANMKPTNRPDGAAASANITKRIQELADWRGETLAHVRQLIHDADPDIEEEWKWMGTPVWSHDGGVCTGESYKHVVKLTFFRGASIEDPEKLFNSSLEGNTRRAIDLREGEKIDDVAFKQLVRAAVAANSAARAQRAAKKK